MSHEEANAHDVLVISLSEKVEMSHRFDIQLWRITLTYDFDVPAWRTTLTFIGILCNFDASLWRTGLTNYFDKQPYIGLYPNHDLLKQVEALENPRTNRTSVNCE